MIRWVQKVRMMLTSGGDDAEQQECAKPKVRPIQMGEWLRKWVSKRLLRLNASDIGKIMVATRQLGVGTPGGAEALAIFHQQLYDC